MNATAIPSTANDCWGFWGAMEDQAEAAWPLVMTAIADTTGEPLESVRIFLDSRYGRQFSDDVRNNVADGQPLDVAVRNAAKRWMGWTIGARIQKTLGIPKGLPYLTGFVVHSAMIDESEAA